MEETQHNVNDNPENGQQSPELARLSAKKSIHRTLAITFGLLQLVWLGWLAFVAWKVLSS